MGNLGGLLVVIFSPVNIGQFQRPSPTELIQFHCALVGALLLGGFTDSSWYSHSATVSVSAPRTVTGITRLSVEPGVREAR